MKESKGKRIPDLCSTEAEGMTTMLFCFEGVDDDDDELMLNVLRCHLTY